MTVLRLHKLLGKMIEEGRGRHPVCVDKPTFTHPLEGDGVAFLTVRGCHAESILQMNDDGGTLTRADGRESYRQSVVLTGSAYQVPQTRGAEGTGIA